jgi:hypothetical protein
MEAWKNMDPESPEREELAFQFELLEEIADSYHRKAVQEGSMKDEKTLKELDREFYQQIVEGLRSTLVQKGSLKSFVMFINTEGVRVYITDRDPNLPVERTTMHLDKCKELFTKHGPFTVVDMFSQDFLVPDIKRSLIRLVMTNVVSENMESYLIEFDMEGGEVAVVRHIPIGVEESDNVLLRASRA